MPPVRLADPEHRHDVRVVQLCGRFGLSLETQRDVLLLVVEEHMARHVLETICEVGEFESVPGRGIAIQIDVEDAVGVSHQVDELMAAVEEEL